MKTLNVSRVIKLAAFSMLSFFMMSEASAQSSQNMNVSASVPTVCIIPGGGTNLNMGFDLTGLAAATGPFTQTADVTWRCSQGLPVQILISEGGSGDDTARTMSDGGTNTLSYSLSTPTNGNWGATNGNGVSTTGNGLATDTTTTISGTVALADAQAAPVATYNDLVTISLVF